MSYGIRVGALGFALVLCGCGQSMNAPAPDGAMTLADGGVPDLSATDGSAPGGSDGAVSDGGGMGVTTIRIHYPVGMHTLALRGDTAPLDWNQGIPLTQGASGVFTYTFAAPPAQPVAYKPLLDDATWSRGANYTVKPGQTVDIWPHFIATHGTVEKLFADFHSNALNDDRVVWAYLPPSYDENTLATYPVVYMQDGQNLFDPALAFGGNEWKVDETLDGAAEGDGSIRELIVIGPENDANRIYEYTPTTDPTTAGGGGGDLYLKMLITELKPQVDAMLRTQPGPATTGILGSSLGGLISAYAGITHPDVFGLVGAMSPSTWWNGDWIVGQVNAMTTPRPSRVYVDCGQPDDDYSDTVQLVAAWLGRGYVEGGDFEHVYQMGGQHNEIYWAERLPGALAFLFGPR